MSPERDHKQRTPRHRVLLVREWDEQLSGSGCCGRLGSETAHVLDEDAECEPDPYARTRVDMERVGAVYRALHERFADDEIELIVVDPRNAVWLMPAIWGDARRRGLSIWATLWQLNAGTAACALVCDGVVLRTDAEPEEAVAAVETDIAARSV